ncbi:alpha/beta hydrolase [Pokkaliibacter sp. CJK22405]|uniref:alpha/beta hydrolase n=1 Tax=Pokkaliibacter sp. CJK22405 TaxID=3384615 RepID=UPI003984D9EA
MLPDFSADESSSALFRSHLQEVMALLQRSKFHSPDMRVSREAAIEAVLPFEHGPADAKHCLLLVHGLTDTPFTFREVAAKLAEAGIRTRAILLEGHGSCAEASLSVSGNSWRRQVRQHIEDLSTQGFHVWVGGFSLGGMITTLEGLKHPDVEGLILWAPAWRSKNPLVWASRFIAPFRRWHSRRPERDYTRYSSFSVNAIHQFHRLAIKARRLLGSLSSFDKPVFICCSGSDATISTPYVWEQFRRLRREDSELLWLGDLAEAQDEKGVDVWEASLPEQHIRTLSHCCLTFSERNSHYGREGDYRHCLSRQFSREEWEACMADPNIWYSEYGYPCPGGAGARLTFNPHFDAMMDKVVSFLHHHAKLEVSDKTS